MFHFVLIFKVKKLQLYYKNIGGIRMMKKYFIIIILIILIFTTLTPTNVLAIRGVEVTLSTDDLVVAEGANVILEVKFTNNTGSSVGILSYSVNGGTPVSISTDNVCSSPGSYHISIDHTVNFGPNTQSEVYVDLTYSGTAIMNARTVSSNTIVFEKAESVNTALEFIVIPDTTAVETGGDVEYSITVKNNGTVGYDNFEVTLNGSVIKTYTILPMGTERTFISTQGYYSDRTEKFGYRYDYTYRGISGQIEETNAEQYSITVTSASTTASPTVTPSSTSTSETPTVTSSTDSSVVSDDEAENYISSDMNSIVELIVSKPKNGVHVGDSVDIVIVINNTGNLLLEDIWLSGTEIDSINKWARLAPQMQKRYVDTVTAQFDMIYRYSIIATDINGNTIEVESEPILLNIITDSVNESDSDNLVVEGLKSKYRYLIAIIIILVAIAFAVIVIYLYKKKGMNQIDE